MNVNLLKARAGDVFIDENSQQWVYIRHEQRYGTCWEHILYMGNIPSAFNDGGICMHPVGSLKLKKML